MSVESWCHDMFMFELLITEGLRERTEHLDILLFSRPSLSGVLFPMYYLLVEGKCQIFVF